MQHPYAPISFAGGTLGAQRHMCAFFYSRDEEYRVLLPFIKEGFERGEKAYRLGDPALREDHLRRLTEAGIDVGGAQARGQFEFKPWEEAQFRPGYFDQDQMISLIDELLESAKQQGYPLSRLVGRMEWALQDRPGVDDVVEFETRVNATLSLRPDPVI
ncbi:MAG: MEDS domain-containing protein [Dehalococcoidia bacterium]